VAHDFLSPCRSAAGQATQLIQEITLKPMAEREASELSEATARACKTASNGKRVYLKQSRGIIPAAAEDTRQLLQTTTADSFRIRYLSLSTFLLCLFQNSIEHPGQFLVGVFRRVIVLLGVAGLGACHQSDPLVRLFEKTKIDSSGGNVSVTTLLVSCLTMPSSFEIRLRCPLSLMVMKDLDSFINIEWKSGDFLGRPLGFPEMPFLN
jgi:hypothetical protein